MISRAIEIQYLLLTKCLSQSLSSQLLIEKKKKILVLFSTVFQLSSFVEPPFLKIMNVKNNFHFPLVESQGWTEVLK